LQLFKGLWIWLEGVHPAAVADELRCDKRVLAYVRSHVEHHHARREKLLKDDDSCRLMATIASDRAPHIIKWINVDLLASDEPNTLPNAHLKMELELEEEPMRLFHPLKVVL
jgi:hypothetical protein